MSCIVITNAKGGVGKSTCSLILSTEFANQGYNVKLIDCDPNLSVTRYFNACQRAENIPENLELVPEQDKSSIVKTIRELDVDGNVIVVDLPGQASQLVSRAISMADLVITPTKPQKIDSEIGVETIDLIKEEEEVLGRKIHHAFVLNETSGVKSKEAKGVELGLTSKGLDLIKPDLMKRVPYSWLFTFGGDLRTIPEHTGKDKAQAEALGFMRAIEKRLADILEEA